MSDGKRIQFGYSEQESNELEVQYSLIVIQWCFLRGSFLIHNKVSHNPVSHDGLAPKEFSLCIVPKHLIMHSSSVV